MKRYKKDGVIFSAPITFDRQIEIEVPQKNENGQLIKVKKTITCKTTTSEDAVLKQYGYEQYVYESKPIVIDVKQQRFSKYKVKQELEKLGLWQAVKQMITDQMYEDLLIADDFAFDDASFIAIYEVLKEQIPNIDDLLLQCIR